MLPDAHEIPAPTRSAASSARQEVLEQATTQTWPTASSASEQPARDRRRGDPRACLAMQKAGRPRTCYRDGETPARRLVQRLRRLPSTATWPGVPAVAVQLLRRRPGPVPTGRPSAHAVDRRTGRRPRRHRRPASCRPPSHRARVRLPQAARARAVQGDDAGRVLRRLPRLQPRGVRPGVRQPQGPALAVAEVIAPRSKR